MFCVATNSTGHSILLQFPLKTRSCDVMVGVIILQRRLPDQSFLNSLLLGFDQFVLTGSKVWS